VTLLSFADQIRLGLSQFWFRADLDVEQQLQDPQRQYRGDNRELIFILSA
jgi:hypothetical protein